MSHKRPPVIIGVIVLLLIGAAVVYYFWQSNHASQEVGLTASGTIEARMSTISSELAGKVAAVFVDEGDAVTAGAPLFELDGVVLKAQHDQALAALESANAAVETAKSTLKSVQVQYDLTLQASLAEDVKYRVAAWDEDEPSRFDQPIWYFSRTEEMKNAGKQIDAAKIVLDAKQQRLDTVMQRLGGSDFLRLEQELLEARRQFLIADQVLERAKDATSEYELREAAQTLYDDAEDRLDDAQDAYDDELDSDDADDILVARAELQVAQETYDAAMDYARSLQTGTSSLQLAAARATLEQAETAVAQSQTAVNQAQANIKLLETQIGLLSVVSPADGVIMTRMIEPGEVISAGYGALLLGDLANLTITVYVPEDRIGEVSLGQAALVNVDSFPGLRFNAVVTYIADQAEFTPRNVQTVEGRQNTVFAVKLKVDNQDSKLKPGMPADVTFE